MAFDLTIPGDSNLLTALATATGSPSHDGKLVLPESLGIGYIQSVSLGRLLKLMVHQYELKQDVQLRKAGAPTGRGMVVFSFRNVFQPSAPATIATEPAARPARPLPTVRVSSADMDFELFTPAHTTVNAIIIAADAALFSSLLPEMGSHEVLHSVITGSQPFLYEAILSPPMQAVAAQLVAADAPPTLRTYYLKLKAEELIFLFLVELLKRGQASIYPLNVDDARKLYQLRDQLLADLSTPPSLPALARHSGFSESKMKRLFRQVFGTSIYSYYQAARMQEAMLLLQSQQFTVSEVGNQLGFINLSHFTRLFERHVGFKPKQFSKNQGLVSEK
jgi:AraC-like DNA-binding protein